MNQRIIDKIQRLLRLAQSDNVNEAASAMAAAQKLMDQHRLTAAMVEEQPEEDDEEIGKERHSVDGERRPRWQAYLLFNICQANGCYYLYSSGFGRTHYTIFGKPTNIAVVRYLHGYLVDEIDRLSKLEARRLGGSGRTWHNNFKLGAVNTIRERLEEDRKVLAAEARMDAEMMGGGSALVRVNNALVKLDEEYADAEAYAHKGRKVRKQSASRVRGNESAWDAGSRAGHSVSLNGRPASGGALGEG